MKYCSSCGGGMEDDDLYCPQCGKTVREGHHKHSALVSVEKEPREKLFCEIHNRRHLLTAIYHIPVFYALPDVEVPEKCFSNP